MEKHVKKLVAVIPILIIAALPRVSNSASPVGIHMIGEGVSSNCSDWLSDASPERKTAMLAWVEGYISQASLTLSDVAPTDDISVERFLDYECMAHPKLRLDMAASLLVGSLRSKQ